MMCKKENWNTKRQKTHRFEYLKRIILPAGIIVGLAALAVWFVISLPSLPEDQIISRQGMHWHSELKIFINGEEHQIPEGIGLSAVHNPIHTHDDSGVLHLEFTGLVAKNDIKLDKFFKAWQRDFNANCIFNYCNGPQGKVKMSVNGSENNEFENYIMKDKDKIEIKYESETQ
ncbi:MAG: hypothetical protein HZB99_02035 [Candidatus Harrisonbacteria bacterium]|nr:hypothetical protein [Candidatus Harrisonbacteria bacterium]